MSCQEQAVPMENEEAEACNDKMDTELVQVYLPDYMGFLKYAEHGKTCDHMLFTPLASRAKPCTVSLIFQCRDNRSYLSMQSSAVHQQPRAMLTSYMHTEALGVMAFISVLCLSFLQYIDVRLKCHHWLYKQVDLCHS